MAKTCVVVGLGSLGGIVALKISKFFEKIYLIDHDKIELKNLRNSIFGVTDVKKYKVHVIRDLIKRRFHEKEVVPIVAKFNNEKYWKNAYDLVVDCTDRFHTSTATDVKLFIASRKLVVDLRYNKEYTGDEIGSYDPSITKRDLNQAADKFQRLLEQYGLDELKKVNKTLFDKIETFPDYNDLTNVRSRDRMRHVSQLMGKDHEEVRRVTSGITRSVNNVGTVTCAVKENPILGPILQIVTMTGGA